MSKKQRKSSKLWQTRGFFIFSTLGILVISGVMVGYHLLSNTVIEEHIVADESWMNENIWRVSSYKQRKNGKYDVYLLDVQPAVEREFEELQEVFHSTRYSTFNSYNLADGVNCQGMVCYIADWCERNLCEYSVAWNTTHVWIFVRYNNEWHKFNFDVHGAIEEIVAPKDVEKGMVIE